MRNAVLRSHKDHIGPKTVSNIPKCLKIPISRKLSVIVLYEDGGSMTDIVLL